MSEARTGRSGPEIDDLKLWVELQIEAPPDSSCLLIEFEGQVESMMRDQYGDICNVDVQLSDGAGEETEMRRLSKRIDASCLCPIFLQHGCAPRVIASDGSYGVIATMLPDRQTLQNLISDIREAGGTVTVQKLTSLSAAEEDRSVRTFALDDLTAKEREVMEVAVAKGYYDKPRRISLGELATEFGVTKQSVSDRLNAAEAKMVTSVIDPP